MFEKEAEEWVKENMDCCRSENCTGKDIPYFDEEERCCAKSAFQNGAEFGYNKAKAEIKLLKETHRQSLKILTDQIEELHKANEWHYVKDGDLPKISDSTIRTLKPVIVAVVNGIETSTYGTYWNEHTGRFECLDKVYAWCDVPESPKERIRLRGEG